MENMMAPCRSRIPWGIYVVSGIYAIAAFLVGSIYLAGSPSGRLFALVVGPICAAISIGIAYRVNFVRVTLMVLLVVAAVGDGFIASYFACVLHGLIAGPANKEPMAMITGAAERLIATVVMFLYLARSDVRDAFHHTEPEVEECGWPSESSENRDDSEI